MPPVPGRWRRLAPDPAAAAGLLLALAAAAAPLGGQESLDGLRQGDRVRVWAPFAGFYGEDATVVDEPGRGALRLRRGSGLHEVPLGEIEQMEVQRRIGNHLGEGALVGGITGAALSTAFLFPFCGDTDTVCGIDEVLGVIGVIGVPPLAVGSLVGLAVGRHEWLDVELTARSEGVSGTVERGASLEVKVSLPVP